MYIDTNITLPRYVDIAASSFTNNKGRALYYFSTFSIWFSKKVLFVNNTADIDAAIFFSVVS